MARAAKIGSGLARLALPRRERRARYVPPEGIPGLPQYAWMPGTAKDLGDPWSGPGAAPGVGDSVLGFLYSAMGWPSSVAISPPTTATPTTPIGGNVASLFAPGGAANYGTGGTDWGGLIGSIGQGVIGVLQAKQQRKMMNSILKSGRMPIGSGSYGGLPVNTFAGATGVPAVTGGGFGAMAAAAAGLGLGFGLPDIANALPGGLEESGTGLFGPDLFRPTNAGQRQNMIDAVNPATGERQFWRPVGRPIMFTGDAALLKRTRKLVRKMSSGAGCGFGGRTFRRRRRC